MASPKSSRPDKLAGGCLCGAIRYTVTITPEVGWPPTENGSCQCTLCRKFTGSLIHGSVTLPLSSITPPFTSNTTYTQFASTENGRRGFCSTCGSSLTFSEAGAEKVEVLFGSFDEDVLRGRWGSELCKGNGHIWCENAVKGVSDSLNGTMWSQGHGGEKMADGEEKDS